MKLFHYFSQLVCRIVFVTCLSIMFKICNNTFFLLTETTGEILQKTLHPYLKIVHRKNVSLVSNKS